MAEQNDNNGKVDNDRTAEQFADAIFDELGGPSTQETPGKTEEPAKAGDDKGKTRDDAGRFKGKQAEEVEAADDDDTGGEEVDADKRGYTRKLEEVNYTVRNLEKRMDALIDRIDAQGGKATKAQAEQLDELKESLEEIDPFKGREDFEELTVADARKLAKQLKGGNKPDDELRKQVNELRADLARQKAERAFIRENPTIADQYEDIVTEAWKHADEDYKGVADDNPMKIGAVNTYMKLIAKGRAKRAASVKEKSTATPEVPPRPSNKTDSSTKGAQAVSKGASRAGDANAPVDEDARFNQYADAIAKELA